MLSVMKKVPDSWIPACAGMTEEEMPIEKED